jgi:hypothetical protein
VAATLRLPVRALVEPRLEQRQPLREDRVLAAIDFPISLSIEEVPR